MSLPNSLDGWRAVNGTGLVFRPPLGDPRPVKLVLCPVPPGESIDFQLGKLTQVKIIRDGLPESRFAACLEVGLVDGVPAMLEAWIPGEEAEQWLGGTDDQQSRRGETAPEWARFSRCRRSRVRVGEQFVLRVKDLHGAGVVWVDAKLPNAVLSASLEMAFIDGATAWEPGRPLLFPAGTGGHYANEVVGEENGVVVPAPSSTADFPAVAAVLFRLLVGLPVPLRDPSRVPGGGPPLPGDAIVDFEAWHAAFAAVGVPRPLAENIRALRRPTPDDRGCLEAVVDGLREYADQLEDEELPAANRRWPWLVAAGALLVAGGAAAYLSLGPSTPSADVTERSSTRHGVALASSSAGDDASLVGVVAVVEPGAEYDLRRSVVTPPAVAPAAAASPRPARQAVPRRGTAPSLSAVVATCGRDHLPTAGSYRSVPSSAESWAWFEPGSGAWRVAYPGGHSLAVRESDALLVGVYFNCSG